MAVTNRKLLQLAGSTLENIKALAGDEVIQARELLVATDTGNIVVGLGDGNYNLIGSAAMGTTEVREATTPVKGNFFFDTDHGHLFIGDGTTWVPASGGHVVDATEDNIAVFDDNGTVKDSGYSIDDSKTGDKVIWTADKVTSAITNSVNGMSWQAPVKSVVDTLPTEPAPVEGDRYLVIAEEGDNKDKIVTFDGTEWVATDPVDGMAVFVEDTDHQYAYNGTEWANISAGFTYEAGNGVSLSDNKFSAKAKEKSGVEVTADGIALVTDGESIVVNESGEAEFGNLDFGVF